MKEWRGTTQYAKLKPPRGLRLPALLLAAALLFCSCGAPGETRQAAYEPGELMQEVNLSPSIVINPVLYFLNETGTKLAAETREISVPQEAMRETYVVQALIDGPVSELLTPVAEGFRILNIELLPDVVNVYLAQDGYRSETGLINAKIAIASTLADFSGKTYINVFINGVQDGYKGQATGALQKTNDLAEELNLLQQKASAENPNMYAVLYFLDVSETLLLPEPRRLVFSSREYVPVLVEELIRGPEDAYSHKPVMNDSLKLLDYEIVPYGQSGNVVRLNFNKELFSVTEKFIDSNKMAIASLAYTIGGFVPDVYGVEVLVNGVQRDPAVYTGERFSGLLGSNVLLYLQSRTTSSILVGVEHVIRQEEAYHPQVILAELMKGPSAADDKDVVGATMPRGIAIEAVREVYIASDVLVIDFDASVGDTLQTVSDDDEFVMIFSIVNTMTSIEGVRRVQFLVEGERVEYLGGGAINIIDPIMKNPGIVRY